MFFDLMVMNGVQNDKKPWMSPWMNPQTSYCRQYEFLNNVLYFKSLCEELKGTKSYVTFPKLLLSAISFGLPSLLIIVVVILTKYPT